MTDPSFVITSTVDGTAVFDGGVVADGREAVVPGFGARTLVLSGECVQDHGTLSWGASINASRAKTYGQPEEGTKHFEEKECLSGKAEGGWREREKREARRSGDADACRKPPFGMIALT